MAVLAAALVVTASLVALYSIGIIGPRGSHGGGKNPGNPNGTPPLPTGPVTGVLIYQPGGTNYSGRATAPVTALGKTAAVSQAYGALESTSGTVYRVQLGSFFSDRYPLAIQGTFTLTSSSTPGYFGLSKFVAGAVQSVPTPGSEITVTSTAFGVAAANLTFGFTVGTLTPIAYVAFGTYPTFFSNVTMRGVDLNASMVTSFLNVNITWLVKLVRSADPNLPSTVSQILVVNHSIELPDVAQVRGQAQVIITPENVSAFVTSLSSSTSSADVAMVSAAMNVLNEELIGLSVVSVGHVTFYLVVAPTVLTRGSLQGLVTLDVEPSVVSLALAAGANSAIHASGSPVTPLLGVTWDRTPVNVSGYASSTVRGLWGVSTASAVSVQAAAVGISLVDANAALSGAGLSGMGYSNSTMISDLATLQNAAVFVLIDPSLVQNPSLKAAYSAFALAIVPNDQLTLQRSTTLYLTVDGVVYNTSHFLGTCGISTLPGCPILVADTVGLGSPASYTPDQLSGLSTPTFVRTNGFLAGTTMKKVVQQGGQAMGGFGELIKASPIDVGLYDLGYTNGRAGYNMASVYMTWGQGPTLEVTSNYTEGLYVPATIQTAGLYLENFSSYIGHAGWTGPTVGMFQSYVHDVQRLILGTVLNGSVPVPGVLLMMDLWTNTSQGEVLSSVSGGGIQGCVSVLNLSLGPNCIVANLSLSANSAGYVLPSVTTVNASLSGNATGTSVATVSCVRAGPFPVSCAPSPLLACLVGGVCSLSPYHVVNVTLLTCFEVVVTSVFSCPIPTPLGSTGRTTVSYGVNWGATPVLTTPPFAVSISSNSHSGPIVSLVPTVYPNPLIPGIMDAGEGVTMSVLAVGGSGGYSYNWSGLPSGCASQNESRLACTPTSQGNYSVSVTVTDSQGQKGTSPNIVFSVNPALAVTAFSANPSIIDVGQSTAISVYTSGGTGPLVYSYPGLAALCLPPNSSTFTCLPLFPGSYSVNTTVVDATLASVNAQTSLTVNPLLTFVATLSSLSVSVSGCFPLSCASSSYVNVSASGGTPGYTYAFSGLPPGCSSSSTSSLLCSPNSSSLTYLGLWGWYNITVTVTDSVGASASTLVPLFLTVTAEPGSRGGVVARSRPPSIP